MRNEDERINRKFFLGKRHVNKQAGTTQMQFRLLNNASFSD